MRILFCSRERREYNTYNLFKSAWPVPTYLAWRCSSWELMLNLSLACKINLVKRREEEIEKCQTENQTENVCLPACLKKEQCPARNRKQRQRDGQGIEAKMVYHKHGLRVSYAYTYIHTYIIHTYIHTY